MTVSVTTKITANPIPDAVFRLRDSAINGHIPNKYVNAIFCVNTAARKIIKI